MTDAEISAQIEAAVRRAVRQARGEMQAMFDSYRMAIQQFGMDSQRVFHGIYRGIVTRNDDPEERGRIQAMVKPMHDSAPDRWIDPSFRQSGLDMGEFWPPEVGEGVWVSFENGNPNYPMVYFGGWYGANEMPEEFGYVERTSPPPPTGQTNPPVPEVRGWITRGGHRILFSDRQGAESLRIIWHKPVAGDLFYQAEDVSADRSQGATSTLYFQPDGSVLMANAQGSQVLLSAGSTDSAGQKVSGGITIVDWHGNLIVMGKDGIILANRVGEFINLDANGKSIVISGIDLVQTYSQVFTASANSVNLGFGAGTPSNPASNRAVLGDLLMAWLVSHTHPTGVGPSAPPLLPEQLEAAMSKIVKLV